MSLEIQYNLFSKNIVAKIKKIGLVAVLGSLPLTASALDLVSEDIQEGHPMAKAFEYNGFGCTGDNLSPMLAWSNPPEGTKSYALTAYDPDAPTGSGWWHWVVTDISVETSQLARGAGTNEGQLPVGSRTYSNDYGTANFGGACPPAAKGMHRYQFTLWAMPTDKLAIPEGASAALVGYILNANALERATLTATYSRF